MGIQDKTINNMNSDNLGASVLIIDETCENSQLLVSLCRNDAEWLSPVGWTEKQKITLLDCRSQGGKTEIDIPAEFSSVLKTGDKLLLKCSELDLTQEITWEASQFHTRPVADLTPAPKSLASGFLSRFKPAKQVEIDNLKTEAERRVEDADKAAQSYKAKMEAATAAKEEAQRKALEAAREAEAALKMEAERIAEMERAAKAFEEAERLKQDELRRVEDERRAKEARLAEEARRVEEARKREEKARLDAERKAALERYVTALDIAQDEEKRLETRLKGLKSDAQALELQKSEQSGMITSLTEDLDDMAKRVDVSRASFEKTASKLETLTSELSGLQIKSESLSAERDGVSDRLSVIESDYLTAQREAEMAAARAEEKRNLLDTARLEKDKILETLKALSVDVDSQTEIVNQTTVKTQKLKSKFETSQADLSQKTLDIDRLETQITTLTETLQTSRIEIEATQQAVEDCQERQSTHQGAIMHLEAGGDPHSIPEADPETRFFHKNINNNNDIDVSEGLSDDTSSGLFTRAKRSFLKRKDAELTIDIEDVSLDDDINSIEDVSLTDTATENAPSEILADVLDDEDELEIDLDLEFGHEEIIAAPAVETQSFLSRHRKSLLTIGALLGGAALLGGGYWASQSKTPQTLTVKTSSPALTKSPASTKVARVTAETKAPAAAISEMLPELKTEAASQTEVPKLAAIDIAVPNLTLTGLSVENAPTKPAMKVAAIDIAAKPISAKPPVKKTTLKPKTPKNYPELTTRIQNQLSALGFYTGSLNGQQTPETIAAIETFKELYGLPKNGRITGKFLSAILNAEAQQKSALKFAPLKPVNNASIDQTAPIANAIIFDTQQAVPTQPVVTESFAAAQTYSDAKVTVFETEAPIVQEATAPLITVPTSSPVLDVIPNTNTVRSSVAAAPPVTEPVEDIVVDAKRTKAARASYPKIAASRNYFADAKIVVAYDIDAAGKVVNTRIVSNDHSGRFNDAFEKAAMTAVKGQKFTPKTINGEAVPSLARTQRIVFKAG